jgi:hypothetical protein
MSKCPSAAWVETVFSSPERIHVEEHGKQTTRHPVWIAWRRSIGYANGAYERSASLAGTPLGRRPCEMLESQPFNLPREGCGVRIRTVYANKPGEDGYTPKRRRLKHFAKHAPPCATRRRRAPRGN